MYSPSKINGKDRDSANRMIKAPEREDIDKRKWNLDLSLLDLTEYDYREQPNIQPQNVNVRVINVSLNPPLSADLQEIAQREIQNRYTIKNEEFLLEFEDDLIFLTHPNWSLAGVGETIALAEQDVLKTARIKAQHYLTTSPDKLTERALQFRDYLVKFL